MKFERGFCPTCGVIDGKVVKSRIIYIREAEEDNDNDIF